MKMLIPKAFRRLIALVVILVPIAAFAQSERFLKIENSAAGIPLFLKSSIRTCEIESLGSKVSLVSAVHVADKKYYEELNNKFGYYEAVLYELIAPKNYQLSRGKAGEMSGISQLQITLTKVLGLSFQLNEIDYKKPYMVHADMSPDEFVDTMKTKNESFGKLLIRILLKESLFGGENKVTPPDLRQLFLLFAAPSEKRALKRLLAPEFKDIETLSDVIEKSGGSSIVSARNKVALEKLKEVLQKGMKNVAIFYGAAHMTDLEQRLGSEFGCVKFEEEWLTAWDMQ